MQHFKTVGHSALRTVCLYSRSVWPKRSDKTGRLIRQSQKVLLTPAKSLLLTSRSALST